MIPFNILLPVVTVTISLQCIDEIMKKDTFQTVFLAYDDDSQTIINHILTNKMYTNYIWYIIKIDELSSITKLSTYDSQQLFIIYALKSLDKLVEIQQFYNATEYNLQHCIDNSLILINDYPDKKLLKPFDLIKDYSNWLIENFHLMRTAIIFYNDEMLQIFQYNFYREILREHVNEKDGKICTENMYEMLYTEPFENLYQHKLITPIYFVLTRTFLLKQRNSEKYGLAGIDVDVSLLLSQKLNASFQYKTVYYEKTQAFKPEELPIIDKLIGKYKNITQIPVIVDHINTVFDIEYLQHLDEFL